MQWEDDFRDLIRVWHALGKTRYSSFWTWWDTSVLACSTLPTFPTEAYKLSWPRPFASWQRTGKPGNTNHCQRQKKKPVKIIPQVHKIAKQIKIRNLVKSAIWEKFPNNTVIFFRVRPLMEGEAISWPVLELFGWLSTRGLHRPLFWPEAEFLESYLVGVQ